jgi:plasmid stabilization system protein ParE
MRLVLTPAAVDDVRAAQRWYLEQRVDLAERFERSLDQALVRVLEHPRAFPVVYRSVRRAPVAGGFPAYQIFYRLEGDSLVVFAVLHSARHPRTWRRRG